jgi:hypothetical protein
MAEIKNNFISCKMNRDIDDRLLPNGQYREARNLQVSRSEGANVGALQNVLGTEIAVNFNDLTGVDNLECIGTYVDTSNNDIYIFLTDYTNPVGPEEYNPDANNFIYVYNVLSGVPTLLVQGEFLNFSTTNPIYGVNLLEQLLFWTDNRNQPRKINVISANPQRLPVPTYYTLEDQISVAKINPYQPITLYKQSEVPGATTDYETTMYDVSSEFLPSPNPGSATVNGAVSASDTIILSDLSNNTNFWPIPKQIVSGIGVVPGTRVVSYDNITFTLVVDVDQTLSDNTDLKFDANPYYIEDYTGDTQFLQDKFVRFSYRFRFDDGEYSLFAPFTQIAFIPKQDGYFTHLGFELEVGVGTSYTRQQIDDETAAYRSTIVEFMKNKVNNILLQIPMPLNAEGEPCKASELFDMYKITEIDILYKESDGLIVNVIDTISSPIIADEAGENNFYEYNYKSTKPYKTLPTKDITRVYDRTPVRALAQEIVSNRVVYGNYQDKFSYPKFLNYTVGYNEKADFNIELNPTTSTTSIVEYPNSSVKQNRTYQVGVVLSDKFGRQSGVILSNATTNIGNLGPSTIYVPYSSEPEVSGYNPLLFPGLALNILFIERIQLQSNDNTIGWPGFYNGNTKDAGYNPLGWVTYKIVVKQTQQDYYNVYLPGVMAAYPNATARDRTTISHISLISDNINKIPRDLKEVGPVQLQFRSSVNLYPRVNNICVAPVASCGILDLEELVTPRPTEGNVQFYPGIKYAFATTIATIDSLFNTGDGTTFVGEYNQFYERESNPLIARLSVPWQLGVDANCHKEEQGVINLAVLETEPDESRLDIFWETVTVGTIDFLNIAIGQGECMASTIYGLNNNTFNLIESLDNNDIIAGPFYPVNAQGLAFDCTEMSMVVWDHTIGGANNRTNDFRLERILRNTAPPFGPTVDYDTYFLYTNNYFYFGPGAANTQVFDFVFTVLSNCACEPEYTSSATVPVNNLRLKNAIPTIDVCPEEPILYNPVVDQSRLYNFFGKNGSNAGGLVNNHDLIWQVEQILPAAPGGGNFQMEYDPATPNEGAWLVADFPNPGEYVLHVTVKDAGGTLGSLESTYCEVTVSVAGAISYYCSSGCGTTGQPGEPSQTLAECQASCFLCRRWQGTMSGFTGGGSVQVTYRDCNGGGSQGLPIIETFAGRADPNFIFTFCAQSIVSYTNLNPPEATVTFNIVGGC